MRDPRAVVILTTMAEQGRANDWLARRTGVGPHSVTRYLNGTRRMPEDWARRAFRELGIPFSLLSFFDPSVSDDTRRASGETRAKEAADARSRVA